MYYTGLVLSDELGMNTVSTYHRKWGQRLSRTEVFKNTPTFGFLL